MLSILYASGRSVTRRGCHEAGAAGTFVTRRGEQDANRNGSASGTGWKLGGAGKVHSIGRLRSMVREMLAEELAEIDEWGEPLLHAGERQGRSVQEPLSSFDAFGG